MKITSVNNDLIKETAKLLQRKYRDKMFLLEGVKCIEEAIESGLEIVNLFVLENSALFDNREKIEVTEAVLSKISSTATPPKAVAAAKIPTPAWSEDYKKIVLLEDIKDADCLIFTADHKAYKDLTPSQISDMMKDSGCRLIADVRNIFKKRDLEEQGCRYWNL